MLKDLIKSQKVKQKTISEYFNVTPGLISQWCSGKCEPKICQLKPLSKILNVDLETLINCFSNRSEVEA